MWWPITWVFRRTTTFRSSTLSIRRRTSTTARSVRRDAASKTSPTKIRSKSAVSQDCRYVRVCCCLHPPPSSLFLSVCLLNCGCVSACVFAGSESEQRVCACDSEELDFTAHLQLLDRWHSHRHCGRSASRLLGRVPTGLWLEPIIALFFLVLVLFFLFFFGDFLSDFLSSMMCCGAGGRHLRCG